MIRVMTMHGRFFAGIRPHGGGAPALKAETPRFSISRPLRMIAAIVSVTGMAIASQNANAGLYEFDPRRTEVRFSYTMAYATQRGRFTKVKGTLEYDERKPKQSKVKASISAASLSTGEAIVDGKLKGEDFFNVEKFPLIAFRSMDVRPSSAYRAEVSGEITVNGITRRVILDVTLEPHDDPALKYDTGSHRFVARTRIQRSDFNMTGYDALVEDDVDLEIDAIVRPTKSRRSRSGG